MMNFFGSMPGLQTGMGGMALGNAFNAGPSANFQPTIGTQGFSPVNRNQISGMGRMTPPGSMIGRNGPNPNTGVMGPRPQPIDNGMGMGMRPPGGMGNQVNRGPQTGLWQAYNSYRNA